MIEHCDYCWAVFDISIWSWCHLTNDEDDSKTTLCSQCCSLILHGQADSGSPIAQNDTLGVKFAQRQVIIDDWYLIGGTRWSRAIFRLKHPIVYLKRGIKQLWRKIRRIFTKTSGKKKGGMIRPLCNRCMESIDNAKYSQGMCIIICASCDMGAAANYINKQINRSE